MDKEHHYQSSIIWTGNLGEGTTNYKLYDRSYDILIENKAVIQGTSDPAFLGDPSKHNPEDLFLASISSCHMLWYLHLCSVNNIIVTEYSDTATGKMMETELHGGQFTEVILHPIVHITDSSKIDLANSLHEEANKNCFIASSLNFKVKHQASCEVEGDKE